jgi:Raf kinase inhibitor-like YbhB/YbcL family protein
MRLTSTAFAHQGAIPAQYTCEGEDIAPPLAWSEAPPGTHSYALIVDDPDAPDPAAPKMTWVHWVVYNLPAGVHALPAGGRLPPGAHSGLNDWHRTGWGGPCPPIGRHRYFFKLYALDRALPEVRSVTKPMLEQAMQDHVLAQAELVATYQKQRR